MNKTRKILSAILALTMCATMLASCGNTDSSKASDEITPAANVTDSMADNSTEESETDPNKPEIIMADDISADDAVVIAEKALDAIAKGNSEDIYYYSDCALLADGRDKESWNAFYEANKETSFTSSGEYSLSAAEKNDTFVEMAQAVINTNAFSNISAENCKVEDAWKISGTFDGIDSSIYVVKVNGEWKADFVLAAQIWTLLNTDEWGYTDEQLATLGFVDTDFIGGEQTINYDTSEGGLQIITYDDTDETTDETAESVEESESIEN